MISRTVLESNSCTLRRAGLAALLVFMVLLATAGVPSLALGATRYAAPSGSASAACTATAPCSLASALTGGSVSDGDTVSLEPGSYPPVFGDLQTTARLSILGLGAHPGDTVVNVVGNFEVQNLSSTISNLSLNVQGSLGFLFLGSLADRLLVNSTGSGGILRSCSIFHGELRDSVCTNAGGKAAIYAQSASASQTPGAISVTLRNVTAYCTGPFSAALLVGGVSGAPATVNVTNSILRDVGGYADIRTYSEQAEPVAVNLDYSNFGSTQPASPTDIIAAPGTGAGNQTAAPGFVNAASLNLHEASGSPTINSGTSTGIVASELDADNNARVQGTAPDIGGYEYPGATPTPRNPTAAFTFSPSSVLTGQSVFFDASSSSDPNSGGSIGIPTWSFGDGGSATAARVSHSYAHPGTDTVTLTVRNNFGLSSSISHQVVVRARAARIGVPAQSDKTTFTKVAPVRLTCGSGDLRCSGTLTLTASVKKVSFVRVHGKRVRRVKTVTETLGRARFRISPNGSATVLVGLSQRARSLIRSAGRSGLRAHATARSNANTARADIRLTY